MGGSPEIRVIIKQFTPFFLKIPFKNLFSHHLKTRSFSDTFFIQVVDSEGNIGWGEALARPYLTGETPEICREYLTKHFFPSLLGKRLSFSPNRAGFYQLLQKIHSLIIEPKHPDISHFNACRCALELALLDLILKKGGLSLSTFLIPKKNKPKYSGVISSGNPFKALLTAMTFRKMGLGFLKFKIQNFSDLYWIIPLGILFGRKTGIRLDANRGLTFLEANKICKILSFFPIKILAFEEPFKNPHLKNWISLQKRTSIPLMPDESLISMADCHNWLKSNPRGILNIRIAKVGGLKPALEMAGLARENGVPFQLGCLVGETSLLSAVGRTLAYHLGGKWLEGSFSTHLLSVDPVSPQVIFGKNGRGKIIKGKGLGVKIERADLETMI